MPSLTVALPTTSYPIHVGSDLALAELLGPVLGPSPLLVVTDETVAALHLDRLSAALHGRQFITHIRPAGEAHKTLASTAEVLDALVAAGCGRDATLLAFGGGVVGDLAGFAAATYLRGIAWIQLPTTLLAMVDSSVGGKTGVNHPHGKNLIGAFHQPRAVLADLAFLATLPEREFRAGLAEVIKYGLALDPEFLGWLEQHLDEVLAREPAALEHVVLHCCTLKAAVVSADEREHGARALLNLGHSFGHALETWGGHREWLHGEAVAIGLVMETRLAVAIGIAEPALLPRVVALVQRAGLPVAAPAAADLAALLPALRHDKKNRATCIRLVLPTAHGRATLHELESDTLLAAAFPTSAGA